MLRSSVVGSPAAGGPAGTAQFLGGGTTVHGGVKFYRGAPKAARSYVEADHSRADDYYLAEGTGLAELQVGTGPERVPRDLEERVADGVELVERELLLADPLEQRSMLATDDEEDDPAGEEDSPEGHECDLRSCHVQISIVMILRESA